MDGVGVMGNAGGRKTQARETQNATQRNAVEKQRLTGLLIKGDLGGREDAALSAYRTMLRVRPDDTPTSPARTAKVVDLGGRYL